ncbi:MAG: HpcH/HpaI aldolase family protein [Anaerolineae bacterium]
MRNQVKAKLGRDEATVGTWTMIGHPVVAEILAQAGFDWVVLDVEHGVMDWPRVLSQVQAVQGRGVAALCRLPVNAPEHFKWALDLGAEGVIIPFVRTAEDARQAVEWAKYPPEGSRGVGVCRAHGYGATFQSYVDSANTEVLVVVQIEHIEAVRNIEEICAVPGVDVVFVGPYDLSGTMGLMGEVHHPDVEEAVSHVLEVARASGVSPGLLIAEPQDGEVAGCIAEGFRFISIGLDTLMLIRAAQDLVDKWHQDEDGA